MQHYVARSRAYYFACGFQYRSIMPSNGLELRICLLDPVQEKRKQAEAQAIEASSTFKSVVIEWLEMKDQISDSYRAKIKGTFEANVYSRIGDFPVKEITSLRLFA